MSKKKPSESETISLPPFPWDTISVREMYAMLGQLCAWYELQRGPVNRYLNEECLPRLRGMASLEVHEKLPVLRFFVIGQQMRSLREAWDQILRTYGNDWDGGRAKDRRHGLLHYAAEICDCAYLSFEMLEARSVNQQQQHMMALLGPIMRMVSDPHGNEPPAPEEED